MVTARFLVGTKSDDAILRVHEKIRANLDRIPVGIPEPLIVGRGINDVAVVVLTLSPKPDAAARWTDKDLYELADQLRSELVKVDNVGLTYISGGNAEQIRVEPDPEKLALFGVTLQQLVAKVRDANRSFQAGSVRDNGTMRDVAAGQTLAGIPDIGLLLVDHARQPSGLCARRGLGRHRAEPAGAPRLDGHARRRAAIGTACRRSASPSPSAPAPMPWWWPSDCWRALQSVEGPADPGRRQRDGDARLRRDRQRQGERAAVPSRARDRVDRRADRLRHRLARGAGDAGRDPDHDPAHAVRRQADGLHHQPRQPVRADLLHRHPGRRRHRGDREHRPALGDEGRPHAHAGRHRGGGRSRQSDRRRHADRGGGAAADAVRLRADGPLHGADPGQCVGGDAVLVLRRHGDRALADAAPASAKEDRCTSTRPLMARAFSAGSIAASPRRSCARAARPGCS